MRFHLIFPILLTFSCVTQPRINVAEIQDFPLQHENERMRFLLIESKILDKEEMWEDISKQLGNFSEKDYQALKPFIYEQNIPTIQGHIGTKLTYENLTKWYLYRILKLEKDPNTTLNAIISINPNAVTEAKAKDKGSKQHPIYGMPILLKDNINTLGMPTTAGAHVLQNNQTTDAEITRQIKEKGGIILGKANLSEWAYFFCEGCPLGYSAVGGQTLNPYGRTVFETGGSSSGSGVAMAANYAVAAVGTETSGSILSPSSQNSVVGLKPTIGLLSGDGIVPISSTLDTPGPMTKNVIDNAILLSAMGDNKNYWEKLKMGDLQGVRLGVNIKFLEDSLYNAAVEKFKTLGAELIEFEPEEMNFEGFLTFLNADMKVDLPKYLKDHASSNIKVRSVADIVAHNKQDSLVRMPYGQSLFEGIVAETISEAEFSKLKKRFKEDGVEYFEKTMTAHNLDAILSINNYEAGNAAMAQYPCLTVPMGYQESGEPISLTFIARPMEEGKLLEIGQAYEQGTKARKTPN